MGKTTKTYSKNALKNIFLGQVWLENSEKHMTNKHLVIEYNEIIINKTNID